jgi:hypothetical protein
MFKDGRIFLWASGLVIGIAVGFNLNQCCKELEKKEVSFPQIEKDIADARCKAEKLELLYSERIRLTGKPNP